MEVVASVIEVALGMPWSTYDTSSTLDCIFRNWLEFDEVVLISMWLVRVQIWMKIEDDGAEYLVCDRTVISLFRRLDTL